MLASIIVPATHDLAAIVAAAGGSPSAARFDDGTLYVEGVAQSALNAALAGYDPGADVPPLVPSVISDRQFAQVLAIDGVITEDEALAWAARGDLPETLETAVGTLPEGQQFGARMLLAAATTYEREHPLVAVLGGLLDYDDAALDDLWIRAAAL